MNLQHQASVNVRTSWQINSDELMTRGRLVGSWDASLASFTADEVVVAAEGQVIGHFGIIRMQKSREVQ